MLLCTLTLSGPISSIKSALPRLYEILPCKIMYEHLGVQCYHATLFVFDELSDEDIFNIIATHFSDLQPGVCKDHRNDMCGSERVH